MADNVAFTPGAGASGGTDDVGGVHYPRVKVVWGPDGTVNDADVATGKPLPIQVRTSTGTERTDASLAAAIAATFTSIGRAAAAASSPVVVSNEDKAVLDAIAASLALIDNSIASGNELQVDVVAALPAGANVIGGVVSGGTEYETVAASQTDQILGPTGGVGDYLECLTCVVATAATSQVQIKDGNGSAITVLPNAVGAGVGTYTIPLGLKTVNATTPGWKITTAAGVSVIASGDFT